MKWIQEATVLELLQNVSYGTLEVYFHFDESLLLINKFLYFNIEIRIWNFRHLSLDDILKRVLQNRRDIDNYFTREAWE